jgi:hypothetical protein
LWRLSGSRRHRWWRCRRRICGRRVRGWVQRFGHNRRGFRRDVRFGFRFHLGRCRRCRRRSRFGCVRSGRWHLRRNRFWRSRWRHRLRRRRRRGLDLWWSGWWCRRRRFHFGWSLYLGRSLDLGRSRRLRRWCLDLRGRRRRCRWSFHFGRCRRWRRRFNLWRSGRRRCWRRSGRRRGRRRLRRRWLFHRRFVLRVNGRLTRRGRRRFSLSQTAHGLIASLGRNRQRQNGGRRQQCGGEARRASERRHENLVYFGSGGGASGHTQHGLRLREANCLDPSKLSTD